MKSFAVILAYLSTPAARRSMRVVVSLLALLVTVVALYSWLFHYLMAREGQAHSWPSSVYWTLVTMSTVGFGDITFQSDIGRLFSVAVLLTGMLFLLILLPYAFIQFLYVPWTEARRREQAPRSLPPGQRGHVILTGLGPIEDELIGRLERVRRSYTLLVEGLEEALSLRDRGYRVMLGELDNPETYRAARVEQAALVVTTRADTVNTNVAFTVRERSSTVPVIATAASPASVDILELAGCNRVLQLGEMLGRGLARRVLGPDFRSKVIGQFGHLLVAEAFAPPAMVDRPLKESGLRSRTGLIVGGVWDRGRFEIAGPDTVLQPSNVVVLAGAADQLAAYDAAYGVARAVTDPIVILGGGRVGRATGAALRDSGLPYRIVERHPELVRDTETYVLGDAAELEVLQRAGIEKTPVVVITTHDDDMNVYLAIYCRRLRPDVQIIARANVARNISTLHRAGADSVLSYASTGATAIWNEFSPDNVLQLAVGLEVFRVPVPRSLAGRTLAETGIRENTGCNVVAIVHGTGHDANPTAGTPLPADGHLVLIGDGESQDRFLTAFPLRRH